MTMGYQLPAPPPAPGMSRGTRVLLWSLGGCGVLLVLAIVGGAIFGAVVASRMFNFHVGDVSAPADFPVYPGAVQQTGVTMGSKNPNAPFTVSLVQWTVPARGDKATAWYREHLDAGDWALDGETNGRISFHRRSTGAVAHLQLRDEVTQTLAQLEMTGDQPLAPGAHPAATPISASSG